MFILRVFGGLSLTADEGAIPAAATQRRRLALLALLASAGDLGISRDRVAALLWPENSTESARHALEQLLYTTRRDLGSGSVTSVGGMLRLSSEAVSSDRAAFEAALAAGDHARAVELYTGPFLDGVYLDNAAEFERWTSAERTLLEQQFSRALDAAAAEAESRRQFQAAVAYRRRLLALDPLSAAATIALMNALARVGDRAAALRQASAFQSLVGEELGGPPDPVVARFAEQILRQPPSAAAPLLETQATPSTSNAPASPVAPPMRRVRLRHRGFVLPAAAAIVFASAAGIALALAKSAPMPASMPAVNQTSIAVLPLTLTSRDSDDEYFSDGLTDEIIHALSQVPGIQVVARTSAFSFKGAHTDAREIGRKLGARSLLEGSVRRSGDRVRVTVQLVDAQTGFERWSESYDRTLADMLTLQAEIAGAVARKLSPSASTMALAPEHRTTPAAYQLYLRGRYLLNADAAGGDSTAAELLRGAVREDSSFAPAHAALANAYIGLAERSGAEPNEQRLLGEAERSVRRALALDPRLPDANVSLGRLLMTKWDWSGADVQFQRALAVNPSHVEGLTRLAILRALQRRFDDATSGIHRAEELDPLSRSAHAYAAYILTLARRYRDAEPEARSLIALDSAKEDAHFRLASVLVAAGRPSEAEGEFRAALHASDGKLRSLPMLGYTYARAGRLPEALQMRPDIERGIGDHSVSPYFAAAYFGAIGDKSRAFKVLDSLARRRESCLRDVAVDPLMEQLQADPRFDRVLRTIGVH